MVIRPLQGQFAAEVVGLAMPVDDSTFASLEAAWTRHPILVFRDLKMSPAQHIALSRRFGDLHIMEPLQYNLPGYPELFVVSNVEEGGKALAARRVGAGWRTFVLLSDGEMDAGSNWESLMFAAHHRLDNLVAVIDYNKLQSLTTIAETLALEPLVDKLRAFGWAVREVDGHEHGALLEAFSMAPWSPGQPSVVLAHTIKGKGVSFMEGRVEWHYRSPSPAQLAQATAEVQADRA